MSDIKSEPTPDQAKQVKREQQVRAGETERDINPRNGDDAATRESESLENTED